MFRRLDLKNSGNVDRKEFGFVVRDILKVKKREVSDQDVDHLFHCVDVDESGQIELTEWAAFAKNVPILHDDEYHTPKKAKPRKKKASYKRSGPRKKAYLAVTPAMTLAPKVTLTEAEKGQAELLFHKLAERISLDQDERTGGYGTSWMARGRADTYSLGREGRSGRRVGEPRASAQVNYGTMFKKIDANASGEMDRWEFVRQIRRVLKVHPSEVPMVAKSLPAILRQEA